MIYKRVLKGELIQYYDSKGNLIAQDFETGVEYSEWEIEGKELTEEQSKNFNEKHPISEFNFVFGNPYQNNTIESKIKEFREMANQLEQLGYYPSEIL